MKNSQEYDDLREQISLKENELKTIKSYIKELREFERDVISENARYLAKIWKDEEE